MLSAHGRRLQGFFPSRLSLLSRPRPQALWSMCHGINTPGKAGLGHMPPRARGLSCPTIYLQGTQMIVTVFLKHQSFGLWLLPPLRLVTSASPSLGQCEVHTGSAWETPPGSTPQGVLGLRPSRWRILKQWSRGAPPGPRGTLALQAGVVKLCLGSPPLHCPEGPFGIS